MLSVSVCIKEVHKPAETGGNKSCIAVNSEPVKLWSCDRKLPTRPLVMCFFYNLDHRAALINHKL